VYFDASSDSESHGCALRSREVAVPGFTLTVAPVPNAMPLLSAKLREELQKVDGGAATLIRMVWPLAARR
jgi:hypothetical protein